MQSLGICLYKLIWLDSNLKPYWVFWLHPVHHGICSLLLLWFSQLLSVIPLYSLFSLLLLFYYLQFLVISMLFKEKSEHSNAFIFTLPPSLTNSGSLLWTCLDVNRRRHFPRGLTIQFIAFVLDRERFLREIKIKIRKTFHFANCDPLWWLWNISSAWRISSESLIECSY